MNSENNTGVLPPEGEESAEFENVNAESTNNSNSNSNNNSPLGNSAVPLSPAPLEVPAAAMNAVSAVPTATKAKREQSAAQKQTMAAQAEERASLKNAGVAKPSVAMVATLASMKSKGDPKYNSAFANAVAGRALNSYRTAKKKGKNTVLNTTVSVAAPSKRNTNTKKKGVNSGTQANSRGIAAFAQTNMRNRNIINSSAMRGTIDAVIDIAESIGKQLAEMKRMIRTLKAKRPRAPRASRSAAAANSSVFGGVPALTLPPGALSAIPEAGSGEESNNNNAFTPPP